MHRLRQPLKKTFGFEVLESRTVLNGTVTVSLDSGGLLLINGDSRNNTIAVHQVGTNQDGGAILQVLGLGTKILNAQTGKTGTSFNFGTTTGVIILSIGLGGGNDILNLYNTTVADGLSIDMGDGNDTVVATNVRCGLFSLSLGTGNNVAAITQVTATTAGFGIVSATGNNAVSLNKVTALEGSLLLVELGSGRNTLTAVNCVSADTFFSDQGADGILTGVGNKFQEQTVYTFDFRFGDLVNDT